MNHWIKSVQDIKSLNEQGCLFNMYETMEKLVKINLAVRKERHDLVIYKYHRKVMYDFLWQRYPELMECRGHVYSMSTKQIVVAAPRKSFNYGEADWWSEVDNSEPVMYAVKYNGFLANRSSGVISTTGSLDSEYVNMAKDNVPMFSPVPGFTDHFEVIDERDPHIVKERNYGALHLCTRSNIDGTQHPSNLVYSTFGQVKNLAKYVRSEGFMVYHAEDRKFIAPCKIKSTYYVGKKRLMRMSYSNADLLWSNNWKQFVNSMPQKWRRLTTALPMTYTHSQWSSMLEQSRRKAIENKEDTLYDDLED